MTALTAAARERERIRLAFFGCTRCGKIHTKRKVGQYASYADPKDGHGWSPRHVSYSGGPAGYLAHILDVGQP